MSENPFRIVGCTISLEVADSTYGNGAKRFASFKAETPAQSPTTLDEALRASLDMHFAAFESVHAAIVMSGGMPVADYNAARAEFKRLRAIISEMFSKHPISPEESK